MQYLIKNARIINDGEAFSGYVITDDAFITKVAAGTPPSLPYARVIDAAGKYLLPGVIDDQVHFREPGLTHKATIRSESRAAAAGGITSFMEMPNTMPQTITQKALEAKYTLGAQQSLVNYSFYMGATNDNLAEVLQTDPQTVCGIKIFMGASTGNMLVDNDAALQELFSNAHMLLATHCEDEQTIKANMSRLQAICGSTPDPSCHPKIRTAEACYRSSSKAVNLAHKYNAQLHILHLSTAGEMELLENQMPLRDKHITGEACLHHLWFSDADYKRYGNRIKWNPAIKTQKDRNALREALISNKLDVVATDHAPHTLDEKTLPFPDAPSGGPMVQHALPAMLELSRQGVFSMHEVVNKMAHAPAELFRVHKRGYIREGYYADLVLVDAEKPWTVTEDNILYQCKWSPMEGQTFHHQISHTFVNGALVYKDGAFTEDHRGMRLQFAR